MKLTREILADLAQNPREWRGDCPVCIYGKEIFSLRVRPGRSTIARCYGLCCTTSLQSAIIAIAGGSWNFSKNASVDEMAAAQAKQRDRALRLWDESIDVAGTIGEVYLVHRHVPHLVASKALRFHKDMFHPLGRRPGLVALVVDVTGSPIAVHRTYLAPDGCGKADVTPQKKSLGPVRGGAIRLTELEPDKPLVIGEGIETAASAGLQIDAPAWAAVSAGNLEHKLVLPAEARDVIIAVDPDPAGERAAMEAAKRWTRAGVQVRLARLVNDSGDFNDLLCMKKETTYG